MVDSDGFDSALTRKLQPNFDVLSESRYALGSDQGSDQGSHSPKSRNSHDDGCTDITTVQPNRKLPSLPLELQAAIINEASAITPSPYQGDDLGILLARQSFLARACLVCSAWQVCTNSSRPC